MLKNIFLTPKPRRERAVAPPATIKMPKPIGPKAIPPMTAPVIRPAYETTTHVPTTPAVATPTVAPPNPKPTPRPVSFSSETTVNYLLKC